MNTSIPNKRLKLTNLLLTVVTGSVVATAIVIVLISAKIGAFDLAFWQIAVIYLVAVAACVLAGVKNIASERVTLQ